MKIGNEEILTFSDCLHEAILLKAIPVSILMSAAVIFGMKASQCFSVTLLITES